MAGGFRSRRASSASSSTLSVSGRRRGSRPACSSRTDGCQPASSASGRTAFPSIFRRPLESACEDEDQLVDEVGLTLIHEAGHYFGLSEEQIQAVEDEFWYGQDDEGPDPSDEQGER